MVGTAVVVEVLERDCVAEEEEMVVVTEVVLGLAADEIEQLCLWLGL